MLSCQLYLKSWVSAHCTNIWMQIQIYREWLWKAGNDVGLFKWEGKKDKNCPVTTSEIIALFFHLSIQCWFETFYLKESNNVVFISWCVCTCMQFRTCTCTRWATEIMDSTHAQGEQQSLQGWGEAFWHEFGVLRLLRGRHFLRTERYFIKTNIYLKDTSLHQKATLYKVFLE